LSYLSTANDGTTIYGEGAEGSPAELDPMGSNVGLYTPYVELIQPIKPEYPSLQLLNQEMPMYVNGQQVTATLDGMAVPLSLALSSLQSGSAQVDWRYTDRFLLGQMGIFAVQYQVHQNAPPPPGAPSDSPDSKLFICNGADCHRILFRQYFLVCVSANSTVT
jgi:hypothetical protein